MFGLTEIIQGLAQCRYEVHVPLLILAGKPARRVIDRFEKLRTNDDGRVHIFDRFFVEEPAGEGKNALRHEHPAVGEINDAVNLVIDRLGAFHFRGGR